MITQIPHAGETLLHFFFKLSVVLVHNLIAHVEAVGYGDVELKFNCRLCGYPNGGISVTPVKKLNTISSDAFPM